MTTNHKALARVLSLAILAPIAVLGCDSGERLFDVSGTVTFNGRPVPAGTIFFDPDPTKGGKGTQGVAAIKDGRFTTASDGIGLNGGSYIVRISGFDGNASNAAPLGRTLFKVHRESRDIPARNAELTFDIPASK